MKKKCAVCGQDGAMSLETVAGHHLGWACADSCIGLLWTAHFVRVTGGGEYEHSLCLWEWKQRRAHVEGRPFNEPLPESPAEVTLNIWAAGLPEAASGLEQ